MKNLDKLNEVYAEYGGRFESGICSFHNLLWQLMINRVQDGKEVAFTPIVTDPGYEIVLADANAGGYLPTGVFFMEGTDFNQASEIAEALNVAVFDLDKNAYFERVARSMRGRKEGI